MKDKLSPWPCVLVGAALLFAPWARGAVDPWAIWTLEGILGFGVILSAVGLLGAGIRPARRTLWDARWGAPLVLLLLYVALQALNPTHTFSRSDWWFSVRPHWSGWPGSMDAVTAWWSFGLLLAYAAAFWLARAWFADRRRRFALACLLAAQGFGMAVGAMMQGLSSATSYFATLFINTNNYAAYLNLLVPLALALGRTEQLQAQRELRRSHPGYLFYLAAGVMAASVVFSGSRAGMAVCAGMVAAYVLQEILVSAARGESAHESRLAGLLFPLGVAVAILLYVGLAPAMKRWAALEGPNFDEGRLSTYAATWRMVAEHPWFGTGAGTFNLVFPYFHPEQLAGFWRFAHNDWLQYLAELGAVGTLLLAGVLAGIAFSARAARRAWPVLSQTDACLRRGLTVGLLGVAMHAVVDFPLHIPAIATLAAVYAGLWSLPLGRSE